jgi:SAM-dependent methyltransferase
VNAPLPPLELVTRVGSVPGADPVDFYLQEGANVRRRLEDLLGNEWSFAGRRVLDFGCGSGRVLRHFLTEASEPGTEFWGCDIDGPSIAWLNAHLSPPLHCFQNRLDPPLELDSERFDLIWATSVFTHIDSNWADWLVEMHRMLVPGGLLIASWLGEGVWEAMLGEPYRPDEVGMTMLRHWDVGGSWVFHSEWWLREHWGRGFDVVAVTPPPRAADGTTQVTHSYITLRKRATWLSTQELERCRPEEPRELAALATNLRLMRRQTDELLAGELTPPRTPSLPRRLIPALRRRASRLSRFSRTVKKR